MRALDNYERALQIHRRHGDDGGLAFTLSRYGAMKCTLPEQFDEGLELIEQAVLIGRPVAALDALVDAHFWGVYAYASRGRPEAARRHSAGTLDAATASHDNMRLRQAHRVRMMVAQLTGDWDAALVEADEVEKVSAQARPSLLAVRAVVEAQKGNPERARRLLAESFKPAGLWDENPWFPPWWAPTIAAAKVGLMLDEPNVIREQDDRGEEWNRPASAQDYPVVQWRVGRAVAAALTGDLARARLWHDQLLPKARTMAVDTGGPAAWTTPLSVDRVLGLSATAFGDVKAASDHYEHALSFCRTAGYDPELAWTCRDYARFLLDHGGDDLTVARELVVEATEIASKMNMRLLQGQLRNIEERLSARRGGRPDYPDGLTEREVQVLRLLAAGRSNREIAELLVISENTAIRHVSNVYAKAGVSSRAEAVRYAIDKRLAGTTESG